MLMRHEDIKTAKPIDLDRCYAASDKQRELTQRSRALLAAAGMDEPARRWFVGIVMPGQDGAVAKALTAAGVEVWKPVVMVPVRRRGGMKKGEKPKLTEKLPMAGMIFVKVKATVEAISGLREVDGFARVLDRDGRPIPIPDADVDLFRRYLGDDPQAKATVTDALRVGDPVQVRSGPLRMLHGILNAVDDDRGRAIVEIMVFGRANAVAMDVAQLNKL